MEQFCLARGLTVGEWVKEIGGGMNLRRKKLEGLRSACHRQTHQRPGRAEAAVRPAHGGPVGRRRLPVADDAQALASRPQPDPQPDITLHTPHQRVKQILQERADRQRIRLPIQDSRHREVPESEPSDHAHAQL
jgi:hypothetical protein